jgi:hypothetical protein
MYSYIVLVVVLLTSNAQTVRGAACTGNTQLTAADIKAALDAHNLARSHAGNDDAANELKLVWNDDLAKRAQDWANLCIWEHRLTTDCSEKESVGQNLAITTAGNYDIAHFVDLWDEEKEFYSFQSGDCSKVCGHYTQVVWATNMEVGCGIARCPKVEGSYNNAWVFACDYSPGGNYQGQKPYVEGVPCSECSSVLKGGYMCKKNLCMPCTPYQHGRKCKCDTKVCENGGQFNRAQCRCDCPKDYYGENCEKKCECVDPSPHCASWSSYCKQPAYAQFMKDNCAKTCKMCDLPQSCF